MVTSKLSDKEKQILLYIITNCEIYHLNEEEALKYIKNNFSRTISRRTYYNYKNKVYENHEKKSPYSGLLKMLNFKGSKELINLSLMFEKHNMVQDGIKANIRLEDFDRLDRLPKFYEKLHDGSGAIIKQTENFLEILEKSRQLEIRNNQSIPDNATIREEYVKCGKSLCFGCKHGPYYYAYWKDENSKLKKKYLGQHNRRNETLDKEYSDTILGNKENL
jgi:hypothetical protein